MKNLFLLPFALLIVGVLFLGCEKEEAPKEEFNLESSELVSSERNVECGPCLSSGGCCCRLISLQGLGAGHFAELCNVNTIIDLYNPYSPHYMDGPDPNSCTIPETDCNTSAIVANSYEIEYPNTLEPHPDAPYNPYFAHGYFAGFCSQGNNLFQVCNPHDFAIEMLFNCELDVPDHWGEIFELQPFECKVFRINNCVMTECE